MPSDKVRGTRRPRPSHIPPEFDARSMRHVSTSGQSQLRTSGRAAARKFLRFPPLYQI
jgi:hypothetical protein